MRGRRVAAVVLLSCVAVPFTAVPTSAVEDPTTGYWTRTNVGAPVPLQPPDPAPEGGSWVAADPAGPLSVTAVRAVADEGNVVAQLRLTIADPLGPPSVLVCPTTDRWAPDQGGRLEAAPDADCTSPVEAAVEEDVLVVDLPADLQADVVDLLLTPAPDSAFSVTFERATAASVVQAPEAGGLDDLGSVPSTTEEDFRPASGSGSGFAGGSSFGIPELGAPAPAPRPLLPAPALPEPAAELVPQPQAAPPAAPAALAVRRPVAPEDRTASLMAVALLAGLALLALRLAVQPAEAPRHLGGGARLSRAAAPAGASAAVAAEGQRGVGRFRASRTHPPVRI